MPEIAVAPLPGWQSFYATIGMLAGTLTGLMWVVMTLLAGNRDRVTSRAIAAFHTPIVVQFAVVLVVAVTLIVPWAALWPPGLLLWLCGLGGAAYTINVAGRQRRQKDYKPVLADWLWYAIFPFLAYITLVFVAVILPFSPVLAMLGVGAVTVLLLIIGIRNAWDTVIYVAFRRFESQT